MNEQAQTWCSWREATAVILAPRQLKKTVPLALIVGSVFLAMNHSATRLPAGHVIPAGAVEQRS
jgi:hypothetical protein